MTVTESHPGLSPGNGMGSDPASLLRLQPMSSVPALTAEEASGAPEVIPRPEVGELPPWQAQGLTQPGQMSPPGFPLPAWYQQQTRKRNSLLKLLGVSAHFLGPPWGS